MAFEYPETKTDDVVENLHGVELVDPYRWLEDQNSPETRAWIEEQNKLTRSVLDPLDGRKAIEQRLSELMKIDSIGMPIARGGRYFFMRRRADQDLFLIMMREGGADHILIDPHPMSADHTTSVQLLDVSDDGRLIAYAIRAGGEDETTIRLFDVDSLWDLEEVLPRARYFGVSLKPDKSGFYYTRHESEGPRVYYHPMGPDPASDVRIFGEGYGPEKIISAGLSEDGRMLIITVFHGAGARKTEIYFQDLNDGGPITALVNDLDARFSAEYADGRFFIETDWDAPKGRILCADAKDPQPANWQEIVSPSDEIIQGFSLAGGRLFVNSLHEVSSRLRLYSPGGKLEREIPLPGMGSATGMSGRWDSTEAFYGFSSYGVPFRIYRYDISQEISSEWARLQVPIDSDNFQVEQTWYESRDGCRVPMFIVSPRDLRLDTQRPTLLTGYGGFNASLTPGFSAQIALWVERGGVVAIPSLRGGGEFGEDWHRAGMLERKQNTFNDFIAAAEWLLAHGYTQSTKMAIAGGSNGGLLVGAALTQRPMLFQAVVCTYPLLDMIRYHRFLVAGFWVPEYGSAENPEQFPYIHAYSPYHQVKAGVEYPAVLFVTGDADTRVDPLHARKMAALLQRNTASGKEKPVLLDYDTHAGHSGGRPLSKQIEELTDETAFLFWQLGVSAE